LTFSRFFLKRVALATPAVGKTGDRKSGFSALSFFAD